MKRWKIVFTKSARKTIDKLGREKQNIYERLLDLVLDLEFDGPIQKDRPNFGKLKGYRNRYHCHIKKGKPTYVVCWESQNDILTIEVYYVGSHEKAPY